MGTFIDLQSTYPHDLLGLTGKNELMTGAMMILMQMFIGKSDVNTHTIAKTQGQICVR